MITYDQIFENNKRWVEQKRSGDGAFFDHLAKTQTPDYLYIGCSDSRVTAEDLMGAKPGEIFVHRNIANLVNAIDLNVQSVIEYAVVHLKVKKIVVCGHYNCGGVKAAMTSQDLGLLNPWLRNIRDVYRLHKNELEEIKDESARYDRLVELNVQEQCVNVLKVAAIQKSYYKDNLPTVHGWVFDLRTGMLKDLKLNLDENLKGLQQIYDLRGDLA